MKVVAIVGHQDGGMVHYTAQLANELTDYVDLTVLGPTGLNTDYFDSEVSLQTVGLSSVAEKLGRNGMGISRLAQAVRDHDPDLVHVLSTHPSIGLALPLIRSYPLITTIHDPIPPTPTRKTHYPWIYANELIKQLYVPFSEQLVVHADALHEPMHKRGVAESKLSTIPHGNYSLFTRWEDETVKQEDSTVLFFGYIAEHKGLEHLLKAEAAIATHVPDVRIIIAGKGNLDPYRPLIENRERFEIHNEYVPNETVADLFTRASVVVLPYTSATQSGVLPIAYSFGTPVVATEVGGLPEVVKDGETGFLVPPESPDEIADAIVDIICNRDTQRQFGERAAEVAATELSWERIAERTTQLYRTVRAGAEPVGVSQQKATHR